MPQQRKKNGELTVRQDKFSKQNVILYLCGILPVMWLGLLIAPCLKDGLPGLVRQFGSVMQNPFQIQLCEDSVKTVLTLLLVYGISPRSTITDGEKSTDQLNGARLVRSTRNMPTRIRRKTSC